MEEATTATSASMQRDGDTPVVISPTDTGVQFTEAQQLLRDVIRWRGGGLWERGGQRA
jgi:hypothetical protein